MSVVAETAALVHGYTMAEVDRISGVAAKKHLRSRTMFDFDDRKDIAWHAVVEELYSRGTPPRFPDLYNAAMSSLDYAVADYRHHHGWAAVEGKAPKFSAYWLPIIRGSHTSNSDGFSDHLCDVIALPRALSVLTPNQYEAIAALAAFGDMGQAADSVGVTYSTFAKRIYAARARIAEVWFEGETPRKSKTPGKTCRVGHPRDRYGKQRQSDGAWVCHECLRISNRKWQRKNRAQVETEVEASA